MKVISASRRTDIPAFYPTWFINRLRAGYAMVRNPFNPNQLSTVTLRPEHVACIVFWTRDPKPLMPFLDEIDARGFSYYFQYTITGYGKKLEPGVPSLDCQIRTFRQLSEKIGPEKVIWRFDPIILSSMESPDEVVSRFEHIAQQVSGTTNKCIFSFADLYGKSEKSLKLSNPGHDFYRSEDVPEMAIQVAQQISEIAARFDLSLETCSEDSNYESMGISSAKCVDPELIEKLFRLKLEGKDSGQRKACGCISSRDIGEYDLCRHRCLYCYACDKPGTIPKKCSDHDPSSAIIAGEVAKTDENPQGSLF